MKKIYGAVLVLVMTLMLALGLSSCTLFDRISYDDSDKYTVGDGSTAEKVTCLDIEWVAGKVEVIRYTDSEIVFSETCESELSDSKRLHWYLDGETLRLKCARSGVGTTKFPDKNLTVKIPEGIALDILDFEGVSADLNTNVTLGNLFVENVSGSLKAECSISGTVDVECVSGGVTLNLTGDTYMVDLESVSGNLNCSGSVSHIFLDNVSGECNITNEVCPKNFEAESVSGSINLKLPENSGFVLDYENVSGEFNCSLPFTKRAEIYTVGDGSSSFEVELVSGNFNVTAR